PPPPRRVGARRPLQRRVHGEVLAVGDVGGDGGVAAEPLLHDLDRLAQGVLERGGLLDRLLHLVQRLLTPLGGLAGQVRLPGLLVLTRPRHVHLDSLLPCNESLVHSGTALTKARARRPPAGSPPSCRRPPRPGTGRPPRPRRRSRTAAAGCGGAPSLRPPAGPGCPGPPHSRGSPGPGRGPGTAWP